MPEGLERGSGKADISEMEKVICIKKVIELKAQKNAQQGKIKDP